MTIEQLNGHSVLTSLIRPDSNVLDLGANVGAFSGAAHRRFGCTTVAVEPNTDLHPHLQVPAIRQLHSTLVTLDGREVSFSILENSECSSILDSRQSPVVGTTRLQSTRFEDLLPRNASGRVDWVKMDVEGAEIEILEGSALEVLLAIDQISVEFHESNGLTELDVVLACISRMESLGFRVYRGSVKDYSDVLFIHPTVRLPSGWGIAAPVCKFVNGVTRRIARKRTQGA